MKQYNSKNLSFVLLLFVMLCLLCDGKLKCQRTLIYVCCNADFCSVILVVDALPVTNNAFNHAAKCDTLENCSFFSEDTFYMAWTLQFICSSNCESDLFHERCELWHIFSNPLDPIWVIKEPHAHISELVIQQWNYYNELIWNTALSLILVTLGTRIK